MTSSASTRDDPREPTPSVTEALARRLLAAEAGEQTISEAFAAAGERVYHRLRERLAVLLGAAGLLKGRRASTHWAYVDLLPLVGASHEKARVVRDGNVFTSGGVTSGIDFAFRIVAELAAGRDLASDGAHLLRRPAARPLPQDQ